jgi:hypothetical protein
MSILGQFQFRRDTAANWTSENPILLAGEMGIETDTDKFKIGDGSTAWTGIAYSGGNEVGTTTDTAIAGLLKGAAGKVAQAIAGTDYAAALGSDDNYVTDAEKTVIGNTSGTNTGDNAVNSLYSDLVTNATHTGDVTGATALTIADGAVTEAKCNSSINASLDLADSAIQPGDTALTDERVPTAAGLTSKFGTNKATIVDGDKIAILDSAATDAPKHSLFSLIKSTLKTYFDTLYAAALGSDDNYVTDAEKVVIGNTSGTNTGDQDLSGYVLTTAIDTLAELNAIVTDATLIDTNDARLSDARTPTAHSHEGAAILSTGEVGGNKFLREDGDGTSSWQTIPGGGDALVANNLDQFADITQTATKTLAITESTTLAGGSHSGTNTGDQDLSGYLLTTAIDTLAELNAIITDATLIDTADSRLSDARTPTAHSHEGTAILSTGETGGTKFLREDGDGTCSWQTLAGGGDALVANPLSQFAATTSSQLAGVISDETGSGALVFATSPTLVTPALGTPSSGTLTNCTGLPEAGLVDDAVTLAKMASGTAGNLITYDASGNPAAVATGTATHVLTSNGAGAAPTFQAATGPTASNIWIPASAWIPKTTSGCGIDSRETTTNDQNFDELLFDTAADEMANALVILPNNYNNGTITARFYWTAASGSGGVAWAIQGRAFANDDALDTAAGTAQLVTDTLIAANDMHVTSVTSAVTIGGTPAANTPIQFTIYRDVSDAADTLGVDARLLGVEILFN